MEYSSSLLHEVSSDEKKGIGGRFADGVYRDWLAELLGEVDKVKDDTDNVELMRGVFPIPKKSRLPSPKRTIDNHSDDDDDCVVLDGDPDKPTAVVNATADNDDNSDDLMVVGEKGEVACRDFPHPRHLCAKFLFASTSHEVHCSQCHCYVCDSLAPCAHWGTGIHGSDHCHASDKEEYWSAQRRSMKEGDKPVQFLSTFNDVSFSETLPETTQIPAFSQPQPNSLLPKQVPRPVGVPNVLNQGRRPLSLCVSPRYNAQTQLASQQLCNRMLTSTDNSHNIAGHIGPQFIPPRAVFKRPGSHGASPNNRHGNAKNYHGSQVSRDPALKRRHTPMLNSCHESNLQNIGSLASSFALPQPKLSVPQSMDVGHANYLPSRPQIHSQPYPSCLAGDPIPCQPQSPSQTVGSSNYLCEVHLQPQVASQPNVGNFMNRIIPQPNGHIPSQTFISNRSSAGNDFENQRHNQSLTSSHPNMDISFENQGSQPQSSGTPICSLVDGQNNYQQEIRTQNGLYTSMKDFSFDCFGQYTSMKDFSFDWDASHSCGNLQIHADNSQLQTAKNDDHRESTSPLNNPSKIDEIDCHYPVGTNHDSLDFQLGSWMFENHYLPEAMDALVSPGFDAFSPEPAYLSEDTLFYL